MSNTLYMAESSAQETAIRAQIEALETGLKLQERLLDLKQNARRVLHNADATPSPQLEPLYMALKTMLDCDIEVLTAERARTESALVTYRAALQQASSLLGALNLHSFKPRQ